MNGIQQAVLLLGMGLVVYLGTQVIRAWRRQRHIRKVLQAQRGGYEEALAVARVEHALADRLAPARYYWEGYRRFVVARKAAEDERQHVCSLYLSPEDGKPLPDFKPGQFLTLRLDLPAPAGSTRRVVRCYSLSSASQARPYRISVKRLQDASTGHQGLVSSFLHDRVAVGDVLYVKAPGGRFCADPDASEPVVLVAGGIGVTPLLSMLATLLATAPSREVWLFYGVRDGSEHPFKGEVASLVRGHPGVHLRVCYSRPTTADRLGVNYDVAGRLSVDLIQAHLPEISDAVYYVCGPAAMMQNVVEGLEAQGVPPSMIHHEAFGPSSIWRKPPVASAHTAARHAVTFKKSGQEAQWTDQYDNLLAFAEALQIPLEGGCRAGNCGTCAAVLLSGEVHYHAPPEADLEPGMCLTCITSPRGDVVLDL